MAYGDLPPLRNYSAKALDVGLGAGIGLAGIGLIKFALLKLWPATTPIPTWVRKVAPAVRAIAAGFIAYLAQTKGPKSLRSESRAMGHFLGAATAGVAMSVWPVVANSDTGRRLGFAGFRLAGFQDVQSRRLGGVEMRRLNGIEARPGASTLQGYAAQFAGGARND